jgi:hypothetical protein
MFTETYLQTTDPKLPFSQLISSPIITNILVSVIFHIIVYSSFVNLLSFIFTGKILSTTINYRLLLSLFVIMIFGFVARFLHVKDIYKAYHNDLDKTRSHLDKLFISWIFIS